MEVNRNTQATRCLALVNVDITSEIHTAKLFYLFFPNSFKKKKNNPRKMVSWAKVRRALSYDSTCREQKTLLQHKICCLGFASLQDMANKGAGRRLSF